MHQPTVYDYKDFVRQMMKSNVEQMFKEEYKRPEMAYVSWNGNGIVVRVYKHSDDTEEDIKRVWDLFENRILNEIPGKRFIDQSRSSYTVKNDVVSINIQLF